MKHIKIIIFLFLAFLFYQSIYVIKEGEVGILTKSKNQEFTVLHPGINFVLPFLYSVLKVDLRIRNTEFDSGKMHYNVVWQISDLNGYLKNKAKLEDKIIANADLKEIGITLVNLDTVDISQEKTKNNSAMLSDAKETYGKLAEKYQTANEDSAKTIRSEADREVENILQLAKTKANELRSSADAAAVMFYDNAYKQDPEFYVWWQNLEVYKKSFAKGRVLVLQPGGAFLKKMNN